MTSVHKIKTFRAIAPSTVEVGFADGTQKCIDLSPLLNHPAYAGLYNKLRDPKHFELGKLDHECRVPVWPDGIDLSPAMLYEWDQRLPAIKAAAPQPAPSVPIVTTIPATSYAAGSQKKPPLII